MSKRRSEFRTYFALLVVLVGISLIASPSFGYLKLHPDNPRYFQETSTGKAVLIATFGGAAPSSTTLNYVEEINTYSSMGMPYLRIWHLLPWESNPYWPWNRSSTGGACMGGNKYDLNTWNSTYWSRIKDCISRCNTKGMYAEIFLFDRCGMSKASTRWEKNPWASNNNINNLETKPCTDSGVPDFYNYSAKPNLRYQQERYVKKLIDETISYPNVIYEIENEHAYDGNPAWASYWSQFVRNYITTNYPSSPRLISYNSLDSDLEACYSMPALDVVNWHTNSTDYNAYNNYIEPRWSKNKAINVDEFANGWTDYNLMRKVCWTIVVSGGHYHVEEGQPASKPEVVAQNINSFVSSSNWDFVNSKPNKGLVTSGGGYCMAQTGAEYVFYFPSGGSKTVNLASGYYVAKWWNTRTGGFSGTTSFSHGGGGKALSTPDSNDWVLYVKQNDTEPPSVPTNVQATSTASTIMQLTWTASTDNAGVAGYKIFRNGSQVGTSTATSYQDTGLSASTTYSYTVSAVDSSGNNSAQSSPPTVATTLAADSTPPSVPTNVKVTNVTNNSAKISWTASTDNRGVIGYRIYRNGSQVGTSVTTSYSDSGLTPATTYSYTVSAYDGDGNSSSQSSPPAVANTLGAISVTGLVPSNYQVTNFDIGSLTFIDRAFTIGTMPAKHRGRLGIRTANDDKDKANLDFHFTVNQPVEVYVVMNTAITQLSPLLSGFVDTGEGLTTTDPSPNYKILSKAYPAGQISLGPKPGAGDGKSMFFVMLGYPDTSDVQPPSVPTNVNAQVQSIDSILVTWTASTDNVGVEGYKIYRNNNWIGTSASPSYLDEGVTIGQTYSYAVSAYDEAGNESARSAVASATILDEEPPSEPVDVQATATSSSTIELEWVASTDNVGVAGYKIFRDGVEIGTSPTPNYTDTGLEAKTAYYYTVSAYDASGNESEQSYPAAMAVTFRSGAGQRGITGAFGLNNIGLLVTVWGSFTYLDTESFEIDDGGGEPIKCIVPDGVTLDPDWKYVVVTGISSCYKSGDDLLRLLRVRDESDIAVVF